MNDMEQLWEVLRTLARRRNGTALLLWLADEAMSRGLTPQQLALELETGAGYLRELYSGQRDTECLTREMCHRMAHLLGLPPITVMFAAGIVTLQDFYVNSEVAVKNAAIHCNAADCHYKSLFYTKTNEELLFCAFLAGEASGAVALSQPTLYQLLDEKVI